MVFSCKIPAGGKGFMVLGYDFGSLFAKDPANGIFKG